MRLTDETRIALKYGQATSPRIESWLERRGPEWAHYWVCVYRNWRNNTFAEYVAETQEAAVEYVRKYPDGEKLKFNPMVKSPAPTPKAEKILPFPVPEMNLETPNVRYVETAVRE